MDIISFGAGILYGTATQDAAGNPLANPTPVQFAQLQDIQTDISFESKLLYGARQFPIAVGRGKGKIEMKAKNATISADIFGSLFLGNTPVAGIKSVVSGFASAVPATPFTVTVAPPSTGAFVADLGVVNAATGAPLSRVSSAPSTGQYTVDVATGAYTFAAVDTGNAILINYEYSAASTSARYVPIANNLMGYMPSFQANLFTPYAGGNLTVVLYKCASNKMSLPFKNDDFNIPDIDIEAFSNAAGQVGYLSFSQ